MEKIRRGISMHRITKQLTCAKCGKTFENVFITHDPTNKNFLWRWRCDTCQNANKQRLNHLIENQKLIREGLTT